MRRENSAFSIKKTTQKEGQRFCFFVLSLFLVLIYHESIYLKQTGPMSKPNSWSAPPMSKGAMSRMGRRDGLFVLYSITVLLHSPVCLCRCKGRKGDLILEQWLNNANHTAVRQVSSVSWHKNGINLAVYKQNHFFLVRKNETKALKVTLMTIEDNWRSKELLTVQPSSSTEKVKRLLPSALSSTSLDPWSTTAFFRLPLSPSM